MSISTIVFQLIALSQCEGWAQNVHWFLSLEDARDKIERWRIDYNRYRPHSSLGDITQEEFRDQHLEAGVF